MNNKQIIALVIAVVVAVAAVAVSLASTSGRNIPADAIELTSMENTAPTTTQRRTATVNMLAVGDNLIHKSLYKQALARTEDGTYDFTPVYENLGEIIKAADLAVINQETMMSSLHDVSTYPCFNTPTVMAQTLADYGFDVLTIANNHMLDKTTKGLLSTMELLESTDGIVYSGAYRSREDYTNIEIVDIEGITFAFLSYTEHTNGINLPAGSEDMVIYLDELDDVKLQVEKADELADVVVVAMHAGTEYADEPNYIQKDFAQNVADWGADLVIGTHPHTLQPVEYVTSKDGNEVPVLYSLGNFVSAQDRPKRLIGAMANITFVKDFTTGEVIVGKPQLDIVITHYRSGFSGIKLYRLADYTEELANSHGVSGDFSLDFIYSHVRNIIDDEYLIEEYREN